MRVIYIIFSVTGWVWFGVVMGLLAMGARSGGTDRRTEHHEKQS